MKKIKYLFTICCSLIIFVFCSLSVACESKGNFFDKSALKRCEIEFLQRPENAVNEKYVSEGYWETYACGEDWYEYTCEIESLSVFENYAKSILQGFIDNNYTVGYFYDIIQLADMINSYMHYIKVYPSTDINDYSMVYGTEYRFIYTKKPINKLKEKFGGRFMGHRELFMSIRDEANESGRYEMYMHMYGGNSKSEWGGNYIFEKE